MGGCRMWWMLDDLGVEAYVLNGGMQAYVAAGLSVEAGAAAQRAPGAGWPFRDHFTRHVTINDLPANAIMTDARAAARYDSDIRPLASTDPQPGHIEGAVSLPFVVHLEAKDGVQVLKSEAELRANLETRLQAALGSGAADLSRCIFSCGSGVSACINIAVARHVGLGHPMLYCGSWSEYATVHAVPIQRALMARTGLYIKMLSPCACTNEKADLQKHTVLVDDEPIVQAPSEDLAKALTHLHVGEKVMVCLKNGERPVVEILAKA
ncbi:thiosulfate/3-mercaptopyruvate sulfurtransferase [Strigomonas culicis]|uniref:Thiosulfate/3-mercaptopyruvate sulfurtransferase n=1 Tax=Strigomonas culicis TaxID=28005 RepID=S9VLK4_9TRYP|nr:thiosulfate/3-mercaptopyruvate sulfurtransferase [Strigomonas culicis]|eukprot:EPY28076.1 thiosulfate/3-mercaptopyruvate sulfurtransferase [Strigomonas culicis]